MQNIVNTQTFFVPLPRNMDNRKTEVALAVGMLILGGAIYLLFRTKRLVMFHVTDTLGLTDAIDGWRQAVKGMRLPEWTIYVLPSALWSGAYILIMDALLRNHRLATRLLATGFIPLLGIVAEGLQAVGVVPGTFDWLDLVAYTLPYIIYILLMTSTKNQRICN